MCWAFDLAKLIIICNSFTFSQIWLFFGNSDKFVYYLGRGFFNFVISDNTCREMFEDFQITLPNPLDGSEWFLSKYIDVVTKKIWQIVRILKYMY